MKILIADDLHPLFFDLLDSNSFECDYRPDITAAETYKILPRFEGLVVRSKIKIDEKMLEKAENLKFVARAGAGLDMIDLDALRKKNIQLFHAAEGNADAVGEHTVGMLLVLLNKLHLADRSVRERKWDREAMRGSELKAKTVGIVGFGNMGQAFAAKLAGFGCEILAYDKKKEIRHETSAKLVSLDELRQKTDILSLHIPLNEDNKNLINAEYLLAFKKNIILINAARGEILQHADFLTLLDTGKITGACLDVLENEKIDTLSGEQKQRFEKIISDERIVLSPHVAGWTYESYRKISEVLANKINRAFGNFAG
jgi:D-3-phosphoglycerate dehydrogenase